MRGVGYLAISVVAVFGWWYLRDLKSNQTPARRQLPVSLERIRTAVQHAVDPGTRSIRMQPVALTMSELRNLDRPAALDHRRDDFSASRIAPFETSVWRLKAKVIQINRRSDGDYYLVLEADGMRGCAEAPDPEHCTGSPFYRQIKEMREELGSKFRINTSAVSVNEDAVITGVGLFGTGGASSNGARLHPVLEIQWLD